MWVALAPSGRMKKAGLTFEKIWLPLEVDQVMSIVMRSPIRSVFACTVMGLTPPAPSFAIGSKSAVGPPPTMGENPGMREEAPAMTLAFPKSREPMGSFGSTAMAAMPAVNVSVRSACDTPAQRATAARAHWSFMFFLIREFGGKGEGNRSACSKAVLEKEGLHSPCERMIR